MPRPNNSCQMRLTATRAVSGFSGETSQRASASRVRLFAGGQRRQHGQRAGLHFGAMLAPVALHVDVGLGRRVVLQQHGRVADRRQLGVQLVELGAHFAPPSDSSQCSLG